MINPIICSFCGSEICGDSFVDNKKLYHTQCMYNKRRMDKINHYKKTYPKVNDTFIECIVDNSPAPDEDFHTFEIHDWVFIEMSKDREVDVYGLEDKEEVIKFLRKRIMQDNRGYDVSERLYYKGEDIPYKVEVTVIIEE